MCTTWFAHSGQDDSTSHHRQLISARDPPRHGKSSCPWSNLNLCALRVSAISAVIYNAEETESRRSRSRFSPRKSSYKDFWSHDPGISGARLQHPRSTNQTATSGKNLRQRRSDEIRWVAFENNDLQHRRPALAKLRLIRVGVRVPTGA